MRLGIAFALAIVLAAPAAPAGAQRWGGYDEGHRGGWNSWYGTPRNYAPRGDWAVGTFYGENGANGTPETITIQPDGSVELRARGKPPEYGRFAGQTLTIGPRISKVEPARGGIVVDGSYYRR